MTENEKTPGEFSPGSFCMHAWQPMADSVRIWQHCVKCGTEQDVCTHREQLASTIAYIFRDL